MNDRFDAAYYERHYHDPESRVSDEESMRSLGALVFAYLNYLEIQVDDVLDLGCGIGHWKRVVGQYRPEARYTGVELSEAACARYGWIRGSVTDYRAEAPADLVICQGVLQYLSDAEAIAAIENIAENTLSALYLEALTTRDWEETVDQERTDGAVHLREGSWYHAQLARDFVGVGGGLFLKRDAGIPLFELEQSTR